MAGRSSAGDPVTATAAGLSPSTQYYWVACFDNPADAGIEDCSPPRTFTTTVAPAGGGPGAGSGPGGGSSMADRTKPKVSLKIAGKLKRGKKIVLKITASDASGIRSITLKIGKAKAKRLAKRTVTIKLPRKSGKLVLVVVVTDKAGNKTTIKRTLKVK
jgi:tRNA threonylcarbamoyladenosine modification (KEOPS) complex  Pcc1 subunit